MSDKSNQEKIDEMHAKICMLNDWHNDVNDWRKDMDGWRGGVDKSLATVLERVDWVRWLAVLIAGGIIGQYILTIFKVH